jgi:hypothetical protein
MSADEDKPVEEPGSRQLQIEALVKMAQTGYPRVADVRQHEVLFDLVAEAMPQLALTDGQKIRALRFVFREVVTAARESLPERLESERYLKKPGEQEEAAIQIMAVGELLGINNDDDDLVFKRRCSPAELEKLDEQKNTKNFGPARYRRLRAAYWQGLKSARQGERNAKKCEHYSKDHLIEKKNSARAVLNASR